MGAHQSSTKDGPIEASNLVQIAEVVANNLSGQTTSKSKQTEELSSTIPTLSLSLPRTFTMDRPSEELSSTLSATSMPFPRTHLRTYTMDRPIEADIGRTADPEAAKPFTRPAKFVPIEGTPPVGPRFERQFNEAVQNIDRYISKLKTVPTDFGEDLNLRRRQIIDCYKMNVGCPLNCAEEALAFKNCVIDLTMGKLNKSA